MSTVFRASHLFHSQKPVFGYKNVAENYELCHMFHVHFFLKLLSPTTSSSC